MKSRSNKALAFWLMFTVSAATGFAANERMVSFDPPGSQGTQAFAINPGGSITGIYFDSNGVDGFLRTRDGTITNIDVPGTGTVPGTEI